MNIAQAQQEIQRLWGLFQGGQMTPEAYTQAVNQLQITDEAGSFWHVDGASQKWYRYAGQSWVEQAPPAIVPSAPPPPAAPAAAPLASQPPVSSSPPAPPEPPLEAAPSPQPRSRLPLWIGLVIILVAIAVVAVLALSGVFSGGPKAALAPTPTQAEPTFTAVPVATTSQPASPVSEATRTPTPTKALTVPPSPTLPVVASPTPKPSATKTAQKPTSTSTPIDPSTLLNPKGPWLLSRDTDNIYLIQAKRVDGINPERVVSPSSLVDMIAPSGGRLAFITSADPEGLRGLHLTIYNLAQRKVEKVINLTSAKTDPPAGAMPGDPSVEAVRSITDFTSIAWSPDGRSLAFIGVQDGPSSDLYSYSLDSGKILHLTDGPSQAYGPTWSPDGKYIVQFGVTAFGTGAGFTMAGAWAARADNSAVISLYTPTSSGENALGWIDANTLLVYSFNPVCGTYGLRKVSIQPVKVTMLLPGCFTNVAYDLASHTIALSISQITSEGQGQNPSGLYVIKLDGTLQRLATGDVSMVALPANSGAVWGYDSNQGALAFTTAGAPIDLPGEAPQDIPRSAPDGKTWAISNGYLDKTPGLWIGPVSGGAKKVFNDLLTAAAWTPSGKTLAFMSDTGLYFALAPSYQPVSYGDIFPATELAWAKP
jgi:Tol biopolymer transport system component